MNELSVCQETKEFFVDQLVRWWHANARHFNWRHTSNPYELLIAEIFLRRTNARSAHRVYQEFLLNYPTVESFTGAKESKVQESIASLGLSWRTKNVLELSEYLKETNEVIPTTLEGLSELPGVGPYIARAMLVNLYGASYVAVDSNVVRILCRFFGFVEDDRLRRHRKFQVFADRLVVGVDSKELNYALLDFAAAICTRVSPKCSSCVLNTKCAFFADSSCVQKFI
jgi:A/G-specific adenine glycosylase